MSITFLAKPKVVSYRMGRVVERNGLLLSASR
jgi:hypothetical protein